MTTDPAQLESLLAHDRENAVAMPDEELARLHQAVIGVTRGAPVTLRDRLIRLPTPLRAALALAGATVAWFGLIAATGVREDLSAPDRTRVFVSLAAVAAFAAVPLVMALRGEHRPPLRAGPRFALLALLLAPVGLGAVPAWWGGNALLPTDLLQAHTACFLSGACVAGAAAAFTLLFDRSDHVARWRVLAAAAGGGLASFAALGVHCYVGGVAHLALAHGLQGVAIGGALLWLTRRRSEG